MCVCVERERERERRQRERESEVYGWERELEYVKRYTREHTRLHNEQAVLDVWYICLCVFVRACLSVCACACDVLFALRP